MKCSAVITMSMLMFGVSVSHGQNFDDCMKEVEKIVVTFSTPEVEAVVEQHLKEELCGEGNIIPGDPEVCEASISERWPNITELIVQYKNEFANESCTQAIPIRLDWDCASCRYRIQGLLSTLRSYSFYRSFQQFVLGPAYCEKDELSNTEQSDCKEWIETFLSRTFAILRYTPTENICNTLYGLCPGEIGCRDGMRQIYEQIGQPDTIERTMQALKTDVCAQTWVENAEGCKTGVDNWWPKIADSLGKRSTNFISYITYCMNYFDYFSTPAEGDTWDCGTCQKRMREVMGFNRNHEIEWIVASVDQIIYGTTMCNDVTNKPDDTLACQKYVRAFMPRAMQLIIDDSFDNPDKLCRVVFDFPDSCQYIDSGAASSISAAITFIVAMTLLVFTAVF
ncbi:hypothetical protein TCAL_04702 [Tigriopus californicus]|uniref:Saposin B-type domain-containing protein n=1 Tax=Tigriopus californicus TaxID=6832 RepID=A0A553PT78_TIGCA|nr:uncharacterized protein LOC131892421 [Tigriopus californicus]TRY80891.1 hypothetical protein TCAL_04702 [Tigriopus californicus]|eukprot:TCALIF_04702-PA protein Name:"Protein of unknown function" AED:0.00 eAED:0.00 QI:61/1/1/1/1/1/2/96/394